MKQRLLVDVYIIESLMVDLVGHDRAPAAFLVYLYLWGKASSARARTVAASHSTIAADTGLSRSGVQAAIRVLARRRLIDQQRASVTAIPLYRVLTPWRRRTSRR